MAVAVVEGDKIDKVIGRHTHCCSQCAKNTGKTRFLDPNLTCLCCGKQYELIGGHLTDVEKTLCIVSRKLVN